MVGNHTGCLSCVQLDHTVVDVYIECVFNGRVVHNVVVVSQIAETENICDLVWIEPDATESFDVATKVHCLHSCIG